MGIEIGVFNQEKHSKLYPLWEVRFIVEIDEDDDARYTGHIADQPKTDVGWEKESNRNQRNLL